MALAPGGILVEVPHRALVLERVLLELVDDPVDVGLVPVAPHDKVAGPDERVAEDEVRTFDVVGGDGADAGLKGGEGGG